jgi:hypothetical protein
VPARRNGFLLVGNVAARGGRDARCRRSGGRHVLRPHGEVRRVDHALARQHDRRQLAVGGPVCGAPARAGGRSAVACPVYRGPPCRRCGRLGCSRACGEQQAGAGGSGTGEKKCARKCAGAESAVGNDDALRTHCPGKPERTKPHSS